MGSSHTVLTNIVVLSAKQISTWSLASILIVFVPRYLGDVGLGQITFAASLAAIFIPLVLLGIPNYLVKEVARDKAKAAALLFNALAMRLPLSAIAFLLVLLGMSFTGYSDQTKLVVYLGCLTSIVLCLSSTVASILQGIEDMKWSSAAEVLGKAIGAGAGILALVSGHGVVAYALILLAATALALLLNLTYCIARLGIDIQLDGRTWRALLTGGLPYIMTSILFATYQGVDATILRFVTTEAVVGWYGAALQLYGTFNFVPVVVATAALPALARMHLSDPGAMVKVSRRGLNKIIVLSLPLAAGTVLISDQIISVLHYPEVFKNSVPLLAILAAGLPFTGVLMVMWAVVTAADRQNQWAKITGVALAVNIALNLLAIPYAQSQYANGAIGAALSLVVSEAVMVALGIRLLPQGLLDESVLNAFVKSLVGTGLMSLAIWPVHGFGIVPVIASGVLVYAIFALAAGLIEVGDITTVRETLGRRQWAVGR